MNKNDNKKTYGAAVGFFLFITATALAQSPSSPPQYLVPYSARPSNDDGSVTLSPEVPMTPAHRAHLLNWLHLTQAARTALREHDAPLAEQYARHSLALDFHLGDDLSQKLLVAALQAQGRDMETMPFLQTISERKETSPQFELPYALLLMKTGQWAEAVTVYNRTLPFLTDGDLLRAHNTFAVTIPRQKDLATAIHMGLGMQYVHSSDWGGNLQNDKAMSQFHQALALEPNSSLANYYHGYGLKQLGRKSEAQAAFQKAAALGQGDIKEAAQKELPETVRPK